MGGTESDDDLVRLFRDARDGRAFDELMRRHQDRVYRLALSVLGPGAAADAEDVVQEVFLRAHHSIGRFRGDARFGSWVYRIAYNVALDAARAAGRRGQALTAGVGAATAGVTAESRAGEWREVLELSLRGLPPEYQAAVRLHYWLGRSVAECAELLNAPENTVKSYLHRARKLLEHDLRKRGFDHE